MKSITGILLALVFHICPVNAEILRVPDNYPTIQAGIDAAMDGDSIIIADGIYQGEGNLNIDFAGKAVLVASENGPENCVVDCNGWSRGFRFENGEDNSSILRGLTICNGSAEDYLVDEYGGAIRCQDASPLIETCLFFENKAFHGGAISCSNNSNPVIRDCVIDGNSAQNSGGGIFGETGSCVTVSNTTIRNNESNSGGGIYLEQASINIDFVAIDYNEVSYSRGGGIYLDSSAAEIMNSSVSNNRSKYSSGGGIYTHSTDMNIVNSDISENWTQDYGGGFAIDTSMITIHQCRINNNTSGDYYNRNNGGGVHCFHSSGSFWNTELNGNISHGNAGAIYTTGDGTLKFINCEINDNQAEYRGGAVETYIFPWYLAETLFINCVFHRNEALEQGGAIWATNGTRPQFFNCLFTDNVAGGNGGAFHCEDSSSVNIRHCTFHGNVAGGVGGAINVDDAEARLSHCILWSNSPDELGGSGDKLVEYSTVTGGYEGTGNQAEDPIFVSNSRGDFFLSQISAGQIVDSPALDAGGITSDGAFFELPEEVVRLADVTSRTDRVYDSGQVDHGYHYPSGDCPCLGVRLHMPSKLYSPGCLCSCTVSICNPDTQSITQTPLFVILELLGEYYFAPGFSSFDYTILDLEPGVQTIEILPGFVWPENSSIPAPMTWYAGLTNAAMTEIYGEMDLWSFSTD